MSKFQLISLWISSGLLILSLTVDQSVGQLISSGRTTAELVRSRGYEAIEHKLTTKDGYVLSLVHATNPLIRPKTNRDPILCVHGILSRAAFFLVNPGQGNYAKNQTNLDISRLSLDELNKLFSNDPAANSIVYLALNVGYEVWLLNRRGTSESIGHKRASQQAFTTLGRHSPASIGAKGFWRAQGRRPMGSPRQSVLEFLVDPVSAIGNSIAREMKLFARDINSKYWNYSLDQQAKHDIPAAVDFVLKESGKDKLVYIGHSVGAALAVMSLTVQPDLADKLSRVVLWSPCFNLGAVDRRSVITLALMALKSELEKYAAPIPPASMNAVVKDLIVSICDAPGLEGAICKTLIEPLVGRTGNKMKFVREFSEILDTVGTHDLAQLSQSISRHKMHHYDFGSEGNMRAYGSKEPPIYNVSLIKSKQISIWYGQSDTLVTPSDVQLLIDDLKGE